MITVMFPSRKRPLSLLRSVESLITLAADRAAVEVLVAADPDDPATAVLALGRRGRIWIAPERFGYGRQQHYYNQLLPLARGDWLMVWGDDALMQTSGWDQVIAGQGDAVLWPQSTAYPYCFPVVPARWARALGRFTPSAHPDTYWLGVGRTLRRHVDLPVQVLHDRKDLTGGHDDATYAQGRGLIGPTGMCDDGGAAHVEADAWVIGQLYA